MGGLEDGAWVLMICADGLFSFFFFCPFFLVRCVRLNLAASCKPLFDAYKACKKKETELRNLKNNGGKKASFFA